MIGRAQLAGVDRPLNVSHDTLHGTRPQPLRLPILLVARSRWLNIPIDSSLSLSSSDLPGPQSIRILPASSSPPSPLPVHPIRGAPGPRPTISPFYNYDILSSSVASPRRPCIPTAYNLPARTSLIPGASTRHCCRRQVLRRLAIDTKQYCCKTAQRRHIGRFLNDPL